MTPDVEKPDVSKRVATLALVIFVVLCLLDAGLIVRLLNSKPVESMNAPATTVPTRTRIVASQELEAFTLLGEEHLLLLPGKDESVDSKKKDLLGRYLLAKVAKGTEIKSDMLAPVEASTLLKNAVSVSIPLTATSSLGGQLRVGEIVDLLVVPANQPAKPFENVLVLNVPVKPNPKSEDKSAAEAGAITVALPRPRRDEFASSLSGATFVIMRRVIAR